MAHTPGPWRTMPSGRGGIPIANTGAILCRVESPDDAALIAAAPDLLAALRKIEQQADYGQMDACRDIARAAIAKAEGK